jgi:predicted metalloprotease
VYVLAHEFGHYLQFRSRATFSDPTAVVRELQADCLAGYTMALTRVRSKDHAGFLERTFELAAALGDNAVYDPDHHGTPEQRVIALKTGYSTAARDASIWAQNGGGAFPLRSDFALNACAAFPADQQRARLAAP